MAGLNGAFELPRSRHDLVEIFGVAPEFRRPRT
jgi:hypothetical protein